MPFLLALGLLSAAPCDAFVLKSATVEATFARSALRLSVGGRALRATFEERRGKPVALTLEGARKVRVELDAEGQLLESKVMIGALDKEGLDIDGMNHALTLTPAPDRPLAFEVIVKRADGETFSGEACEPRTGEDARQHLRARLALFLALLALVGNAQP